MSDNSALSKEVRKTEIIPLSIIRHLGKKSSIALREWTWEDWPHPSPWALSMVSTVELALVEGAGPEDISRRIVLPLTCAAWESWPWICESDWAAWNEIHKESIKNDYILTRCQIWGNIDLRLLNKQNYKWYNVHQFINCPDDTLGPYPNRLRYYLWSMPHKLKSTCSGHQTQYRAFLSTVHQAHARSYQNFQHFKMVLIWLNAKEIRN